MEYHLRKLPVGQVQTAIETSQRKDKQMKKVEVKPQTKASIDVIIDYKKGKMSKEVAIQRFASLTGFSWDLATEFIEPLTKSNVVKFPNKLG